MFSIVDDILIFLFSFYIISHFSKILISNTLDLSKILKVTSLFTSFLFIGLGTSIPEFSILVSSIVNKKPEISFNDLIGSNLVNSTLILGVGILLFKNDLKKEVKKDKRFYGLAVISTMLPLIILNGLIFDKKLGLFLLFIFFVTTYYLLKTHEEVKEVKISWLKIIEKIGIIGISLFMIIFTSRFLVTSLVRIVNSLKIEMGFFSKILLAFSTSIPELVAIIRAARESNTEIIFGDIFGSNLSNLAFLLAILLLLTPVKILMPYELFLIFFSNLIVLIAFNNFKKTLGILLISIYFVYLLISLNFFLNLI